MSDDNIRVILQDGNTWLIFREPIEILIAKTADQIGDVLKQAESAAEGGSQVAGYVAYEAASGLDQAFKTHDLSSMPLAWFGVFNDYQEIDNLDTITTGEYITDVWSPATSQGEYSNSIETIKKYLKSGDTYQVNYTTRLKNSFTGDTFTYFKDMCSSQKAQHCGYIETNEWAICSASPELFFSLSGSDLISRPMKGTSKRGVNLEDDKRLANELLDSEKNRAENVMIVDMVRNDMGRIADNGSVKVESSYDIEAYPTLLQMTSTVKSTTDASLKEIFSALFPCASITGAPKVHTMEIIKELEPEPRGVYTGAIGLIRAGRDASFNVAIRTVVIDKKNNTAEYGVGGGIVWDSDADNEFDECLLKAEVLTGTGDSFDILETLLWEKENGFFLLDRHINRMKSSAEYFGFPFNESEIRASLNKECQELSAEQHRIRALLNESGILSIETTDISSDNPKTIKLGLASRPVNTLDRFLYNKTTMREVYQAALQGHDDCDDVILYNENGEITESTIANVVIETGGCKLTPPASCGLLPGTFRAELLEQGEIEERAFDIEALKRAEKVYLINSVRRWINVELSLH